MYYIRVFIYNAVHTALDIWTIEEWIAHSPESGQWSLEGFLGEHPVSSPQMYCTDSQNSTAFSIRCIARPTVHNSSSNVSRSTFVQTAGDSTHDTTHCCRASSCTDSWDSAHIFIWWFRAHSCTDSWNNTHFFQLLVPGPQFYRQYTGKAVLFSVTMPFRLNPLFSWLIPSKIYLNIFSLCM